MSFSDHSTLSVARDHEGLLDSDAYGVGDLPVSSYGKSPYTDNEIISLDVGQTQTRYRVHRAVLSQSPELYAKPALKLWGEKTNDTILLPELDETTAHTLVHYLYTGRYQTLQAYDLTPKSAIPRYKLSTCVYCAAVRYRLSGLAELAKERITSFGEDLSIFDILEVAREDAFPLLPDDEAWLPAYLEDAIKGAVAEDPGLFMKPGFVDQVEGDRRFRQVVMKAVVNTYSGTPAAAQQSQSRQTAVHDGKVVSEEEASNIPPPHLPTTTTTNPTCPVQDESPNTTPVAPPNTEDPVPIPATAQTAHSITLDAIEPTLAPSSLPPASPEPFTDELGFQNSKTYQNMGSGNKKMELKIEPAKMEHKRVDSVVQGDEPTPALAAVVGKETRVETPTAAEQKKVKYTSSSASSPTTSAPAITDAVDAKPGTAEPTNETANVNGSTPSSAKKNKKNKKKKSGTSF